MKKKWSVGYYTYKMFQNSGNNTNLYSLKLMSSPWSIIPACRVDDEFCGVLADDSSTWPVTDLLFES